MDQLLDETLRAEATRWLNGAFDGLGPGPVDTKRTRYHRVDSYTQSHETLEAARARLGDDYGEYLAEVRASERTGDSGMVAIIGEATHDGAPCVQCEAFDLSTGDSVVLIQPFKKTLFGRKRVGAMEMLGPAELLYFPELKHLVRDIDNAAEALKQARGPELSQAGLRMRVGERQRASGVQWDYNVIFDRDNKMVKYWSKLIWQGNQAMCSVADARAWIDGQIDLAIATL